METTKQTLPPSDPKGALYNTLHKNEASSAHTITVDTTLKGKAQTPKNNGDDIQIDNSLTGMIVDLEGPQDTQAEIMGNSKTAEAYASPLNPPVIDTEDKVGHPERDTNKKQQEISMEKGSCELPTRMMNSQRQRIRPVPN